MVVLGVSLIKNGKHKSILIKNNPSDFPRVKLLNTRMEHEKSVQCSKARKTTQLETTYVTVREFKKV